MKFSSGTYQRVHEHPMKVNITIFVFCSLTNYVVTDEYIFSFLSQMNLELQMKSKVNMRGMLVMKVKMKFSSGTYLRVHEHPILKSIDF